jgi:hypothetical protein
VMLARISSDPVRRRYSMAMRMVRQLADRRPLSPATAPRREPRRCGILRAADPEQRSEPALLQSPPTQAGCCSGSPTARPATAPEQMLRPTMNARTRRPRNVGSERTVQSSPLIDAPCPAEPCERARGGILPAARRHNGASSLAAARDEPPVSSLIQSR